MKLKILPYAFFLTTSTLTMIGIFNALYENASALDFLGENTPLFLPTTLFQVAPLFYLVALLFIMTFTGFFEILYTGKKDYFGIYLLSIAFGTILGCFISIAYKYSIVAAFNPFKYIQLIFQLLHTPMFYSVILIFYTLLYAVVTMYKTAEKS